MKFVTLILSAALMIGTLNSTIAMEKPNTIEHTLDEWLDPKFHPKAKLVIGVLKSLSDMPIPPRVEGEDMGMSFNPRNKFDVQILKIVRQMCQKRGKSVPLVDLGCGHGLLSILLILAGAKVDVVDTPETAKLANVNIFDKIREIVKVPDVKTDFSLYYRAIPENLVSSEPFWTNTPHDVALLKNVAHFLTGRQVNLLAERIFKNLTVYNIDEPGLLMVQTDTPFFNKRALKFYQRRQKEGVLFPGLAIYNKTKEDGAFHLTTNPFPFHEEKLDLLPAHMYPGQYTETGDVEKIEGHYHHVKNLFTVEGLIKTFENVGFVAIYKCYLNHLGVMLDGDPKVGNASKACVIFSKRYKA
jgi:hypothetical protein